MQATTCPSIERPDLSAAGLALLRLDHGNTCQVESHGDIKAAGTSTDNVHVLVAGWACKYRLTSDGGRQIVSFRLPGDVCDLERLYAADAGIGVTALTDCKVAKVAVSALEEARRSSPVIRDLLWSLMSREHAAMTEQIVGLGRRTARQRIACLLYDLFSRLEALGLLAKGGFHMPATQNDVADAVGLSVVHVNRTLQRLKEDGVIEMRGRTICVPQRAALVRAAGLGSRGHAVAPSPMATVGAARPSRAEPHLPRQAVEASRSANGRSA